MVRGKRNKVERHTLDEIFALGPVLQALLQAVGGSLPLQVVSGRLESSKAMVS